MAWWRRAADAGFANSQYNLGLCYTSTNGDGVVTDLSQAAAWLQRAAETCHVRAQYSLGICYFNGDGVPRDLEQATAWPRRAADAGQAEATDLLARIHRAASGSASGM